MYAIRSYYVRVEHLDRAHEQQQSAADLEGRQRDAEELENLQPEDGAECDHQKGGRRRDAGCLFSLCRAEVAREVNEERDDADLV